MSDVLLFERRDDAAWVTLNRPDARNALSRELVSALSQALGEVASAASAAPASVRSVVLTGSGSIFCAGADLKERRGMTREQAREFVDRLGDVLVQLAELPVPVVAALNGTALGGGLELALACDVRIAVAGAELGLPEVRLGIIPGAGGTQRLTRLVGAAAAKEMILAGRRVAAERARELGLLSEVVAPDELLPVTQRLLAELRAGAPLALREAKRAIDGGLTLPMTAALQLERTCYDVVLGTEDRDEGLRAFAEKRAPIYQGK